MSEPTVLGMINDNLKDISIDVKEIKKDLKDGAVTMENHNVRLGNIEHDVTDLKDGQKKIKETFWNHSNNKKKHYNQGYKETFPQKAWRKKGELTLLTMILTVVSWLINNYLM